MPQGVRPRRLFFFDFGSVPNSRPANHFDFAKSQGDRFRGAYGDCIVELVLEEDEGKLDACAGVSGGDNES